MFLFIIEMGGNMTQKELLYVEDAVGHFKSIIQIYEDAKNVASDDNIVSFMDEQIVIHQNLKDELMDLLKEKATLQTKKQELETALAKTFALAFGKKKELKLQVVCPPQRMVRQG